MEIFEDDPALIGAYKFLDASMKGLDSYYIYDILTEKLMNIDDSEEEWQDGADENDIINKWESLHPDLKCGG